MSAYIIGFILGWGACMLSYIWLAFASPHFFCANSHECRGRPEGWE